MNWIMVLIILRSVCCTGNFIIQRGSTVTWTGDPTDADMNITAIYTVNTPSIDLVEQQLAGRINKRCKPVQTATALPGYTAYDRQTAAAANQF